MRRSSNAHARGRFAKNFYGIEDAFLTLKNHKSGDSSESFCSVGLVCAACSMTGGVKLFGRTVE